VIISNKKKQWRKEVSQGICFLTFIKNTFWIRGSSISTSVETKSSTILRHRQEILVSSKKYILITNGETNITRDNPQPNWYKVLNY